MRIGFQNSCSRHQHDGGMRLDVGSAPPRSQSLQPKQDLAARDGADNHAIVGSDRREPGCHPQVLSHRGADRVGIEKIDHDGSLGKKSRVRTANRPAIMAASSSSTSAELGCGGSCIARRTAVGDPRRFPGVTPMSELNCSRANCWMLFRCAAAIPSRLRTRSSGISMVRFAILCIPPTPS